MKKIAIITPYKSQYSETFIKAHIDLLAGEKHILYGGFFPLYTQDDQTLIQFFTEAKWQEFKENNHPWKRILKLLPYCIYDRFFKEYSFDKTKFCGRVEALKYYFFSNKIDLVLAEYGTTGAEVCPVCKVLNIPLIVHFHGFDASEIPTLLSYKDKYSKMFEYASYIVAVSLEMKSKLIKIGCPEDKIILNYYGPNNNFLEIMPKFMKRQIIGVGRFVEKKAPYYTIFAFHKALQRHPEAKLVLAGDGELLGICKNIVNMLRISDSIVFPGVITPTQFKEYLSESIAFVQHSITATNGDKEGTPVSILEASAAGLPVISTRHAGIPDVIINNETGLLVEEHDVECMADCMIKLLDDLEFAKRLGASGKKRIKENFTMEKHIGILNEVINKTLESREK